MPGTYLAALLVSIGGLAVIDRYLHLAFFAAPRRAALIMVVAMAVFLGWDLVCIHRGIFFDGDSGLLLGPHIATNVPIEEVGFLTLLNYNALLLWTWLETRRG